MIGRPLVQRVCLVLAAAGALGAALLYVTGGFDLTLFGVPITTHEPRRPLLVAVVALCGFFLAGGRVPTAWIGALRRVVGAIGPTHVAAALTLVVFGLAVQFGARAIGGSDSYGYVSQAHLWLKGDLKQPQPWTADIPWPDGAATFTPLGYTRLPADTTLVPVYAPGLPMLMAVAMAIAGACAAFLVVPLCGAIAVFTTYQLGRAVSSAWTGIAAAWWVATSPAFLYTVMQPMSDVPAMAMWMLAFALAYRGTVVSAALAGMAAVVTVLIRLNLAPLAGVLVVWFIARAWRTRDAGARAWWPLCAYAALLAFGVAIVAAINWHLYGGPLTSGYGDTSGWFSIANIRPNARRYAAWLTESQTPLIWIGVFALLPVRWLWSGEKSRWMVGCMMLFAAGVWAHYCLYGVFDAWWYLRFFLPALPMVFIALSHALSIGAGSHRFARAAIVVVVIATGVRNVMFATERYAFDMRLGSSQFITAARVVEAVTGPDDVIYSMQHSGSLRHYAGRTTVRYDFLDPAWFDRSIRWLNERGVHSYALLDSWEAAAWRERFGAQGAVGRLDIRPIRVFEGPSGMALYDLLSSGPETPRRVAIAARDLDCQPPAQAPDFPLNRMRP